MIAPVPAKFSNSLYCLIAGVVASSNVKLKEPNSSNLLPRPAKQSAGSALVLIAFAFANLSKFFEAIAGKVSLIYLSLNPFRISFSIIPTLVPLPAPDLDRAKT